MSDSSVTHPDLGLTGAWAEGDAYRTKMNANWRRLDALVQGGVKDQDLTSPPGSPADGDRYIVKATATGAWAGKEKQIAVYESGTWVFYAPKEGWLVWVNDEDLIYVYSGSAWVALGTSGGGGGIISSPAMGRIIIQAADFSTGVTTQDSGRSQLAKINLGAISDNYNWAAVVIPADFGSLTAVKAYYANSATSNATFVINLGFQKLTAGVDGTSSPTMGSETVITPPTTAEQLDVATLNLPAVSLAGGDVVRVLVERPAFSSSNDTNTATMYLVAVVFEYN